MPARTLRATVRTATLLAGMTLLAGCAVVPTRGPGTPQAVPAAVDLDAAWSARREQLQQREAFDLRGRVAVAAAEEGFTAGLRWSQRGESARIRLDGPLGIGGLDIESGPGSTLRLTTGRGERLDGEAARSEVERRLGFALPIEALRYWLQGVPAPGGSAEERRAADAARLAGLEQQGWRVDYGDYVESGQGPLPRRLTAVRSGARVRLVIEAWELRR